MKTIKRMKFPIIGVTLFIMMCITYQKANTEWKIMDFALENVEAIARVEAAVGQTEGDRVYFTFNGQHWEGNKPGSGNRFPKYDYCRYNGQNGMQVYCETGNGNCWNGTSCLAIDGTY